MIEQSRCWHCCQPLVADVDYIIWPGHIRRFVHTRCMRAALKVRLTPSDRKVAAQ